MAPADVVPDLDLGPLETTSLPAQVTHASATSGLTEDVVALDLNDVDIDLFLHCFFWVRHVRSLARERGSVTTIGSPIQGGSNPSVHC